MISSISNRYHLFLNKTVLLKQSIQVCSHSTINKDEIQKFSAIGSNWWDRSSFHGAGPLHLMNPIRVNFIRSTIAKLLHRDHLFETQHLKDLHILDVGCGGGLLSESLARLGAKVTAIDPSAENIKVASYHSSFDPLTKSINYKQSTIETLAASGEKFDIICALEVLEHVNSPEEFINYCTQCLKDPITNNNIDNNIDNNSIIDKNCIGGSLFVSTMNRTYKSYLITIVGAEYLLGIIPKGTHEWDKYITPNELTMIINNINNNNNNNNTINSYMKINEINGMILDPIDLINPYSLCTGKLLNNWKLSKTDFDVNYIVHMNKYIQSTV